MEVLSLDLTLEKNITKLGEVIQKDNSVNVLINNAGVGYFGDAQDLVIDRVNSLVKLNVNSLTSLTILATKYFAKRSNSKIMNVSSVVAYFPSMPGNATYAASKHFVDVFSKSIIYENKCLRNSVQLSILRPGIIATDWGKNATKFKKNDSYAKNNLATNPENLAKKQLKSFKRQKKYNFRKRRIFS